MPTFRSATSSAYEALKGGWADKEAQAFLASLNNHAHRTLGDIRVDKVTPADITTAPAPIWTSKPDIAKKVRQRINKVLNFAHSKGWRVAEAPSKSVSVGLPRQPKGGNFEAMPYIDVPGFVQRLQSEAPTAGRRALLLLIFTAARPGEIRNGRWGQVNEGQKDWNRPAEIMKERIPHTVTLNQPALALLEEIKATEGQRTEPDALFFPNRDGNSISDAK